MTSAKAIRVSVRAPVDSIRARIRVRRQDKRSPNAQARTALVAVLSRKAAFRIHKTTTKAPPRNKRCRFVRQPTEPSPQTELCSCWRVQRFGVDRGAVFARQHRSFQEQIHVTWHRNSFTFHVALSRVWFELKSFSENDATITNDTANNGGGCILDLRQGDSGVGSRTCAQYSTAYACPAPGQSVSACPSANRIGRCAISQGGVLYTQHYYEGITASQAMQICSATSGSFTAN